MCANASEIVGRQNELKGLLKIDRYGKSTEAEPLREGNSQLRGFSFC